MRGPPLLQYPNPDRTQSSYRDGYPSCVVPSPRSLPTQQMNGGAQEAEQDGVKAKAKVQLHPMVGGPYPIRDDPVITVRALMCCTCGILLTVLLLYLLFQYVRQQTQLLVPHVDVGNLDFHNAIYTNRVAAIIRSAAGLLDMRTAALGVTPYLRLHQQSLSRLSVAETLSDGRMKGAETHVPRHPEVPGELCRPIPPRLFGNVSADVNREHETLTLSEVMAAHRDITAGGEWQPSQCVARYRVALVIPYRDRLAHLTVLLAHLLPLLKRQQLHFKIFVVEQYGTLTFNKGRIMNAAFKEALKMFDFQCVVFHDVDLIPEDDRNMYTCPIMPRHMSVAIDEMNYRLAYQMLVGGVLNMRVEHYQLVNGYSNMYWGWGAEDDDMAYRVLHVGLKIFRPPANIARYQMIKHKKRKPTSWGIRHKLLATAVKRYQLDGLNSVQYTLMFIHADPLYTHIMVDIGKPDIRVER